MSSPTFSSPGSVQDQSISERKTRVYEVGSLDTLNSIALKFNMKTRELLQLNGLATSSGIYSGQHLTVYENPAVPDTPPPDKRRQQLTRQDSETLLKAPVPMSTSMHNSTDTSIIPLSASGNTGHATNSTLLSSSNSHTNSTSTQNNPSNTSSDSSETNNQGTRQGQHTRTPSSVAEITFPTELTPSYRSIPLLVKLRQKRDKQYFDDGTGKSITVSTSSQTLIDSISSSRNSSVANTSHARFNYIPEDMKLSSKDIIKEQVRYYINEQRNVVGELILMPTNIVFEPALDDPATRQLGLTACQVQVELKDILDVHIIDAAEILVWWKRAKAGPKGEQSASSESSQTALRSPTSIGGGPTATHLNTNSVITSTAPILSAHHSPVHPSSPFSSQFDHFIGQENGPRFLQLTAILSKQTEGQVGKILYFLMPKTAAESLYSKMLMWLAQAKPISVANNAHRPRSNSNSILNQRSNNVTYISDAAKQTASSKQTSSIPVQTSVTTPSTTLSTSSSSSSTNVSAPSSPPALSQSPPLSSTATSSLLTSSIAELPALTGVSLIFKDDHLRRLLAYVPARYRNSDMTMLYSSSIHGFSLRTFFLKTAKKGPTLLLIEDEAGFMFGAYASESWEPQKSFFGNGESFLFTLVPTLNIYPWSGLNEFFIYAREDTIALGGGSGRFGIWLEDDLSRGSSAPCDTFLNSTLSCEESFSVVLFEVWGFDEAASRPRPF